MQTFINILARIKGLEQTLQSHSSLFPHSSPGSTKVGILLMTTPVQPPTGAFPPFPTMLL